MQINLLKLPGWPIFKQLQLEEALLRADDSNWCIVNDGSQPSIVMGISGKKELLIDDSLHQNNPIPIIRRFSGGGTVVVDKDTCFTTFICNVADTNVPCFPNKVLCWTKPIFQKVLRHPEFQVKENDYSIGEKKFGGNAQYMCKGRWLHHTSLLWDYDKEMMSLLKIPPKMPEYRKSRTHDDFLCCLKDYLPDRTQIFDNVIAALAESHTVMHVDIESALPIIERPHRKATVVHLKEA